MFFYYWLTWVCTGYRAINQVVVAVHSIKFLIINFIKQRFLKIKYPTIYINVQNKMHNYLSHRKELPMTS